MTAPKKSALGKGLGALLDSNDVMKPVVKYVKTGVSEIEIHKIEANPHQPRTRFDEESLIELAENIKQIGLIQPITVREVAPDAYQIISGERRWRASKMAGLTQIPAYIRKTNDEDVLLLSLVENVQREDLDAIEIALSYQRLIDECQLTQEQLSEKVSKPRASIANYLRLLKLPAEIQAGIINKDISMGHAKVLIGVDDYEMQVKIYTEIIDKELSVRKVEELIKQSQEDNWGTAVKIQRHSVLMSKEYLDLQNKLSEVLRANVKLKKKVEGKGEIVIPFNSEEDFDRIIGVLEKLQQ